MSLWAALRDPLQGKTSLGKVFWRYGILGSLLVSATGLLLDPENRPLMRMYAVFGLVFSIYVTVATYRCAGNCRSAGLARFVRVSAIISLAAIPLFAYLEISGALDLALIRLQGEQ
jgi:hypothetical protein